MSSFFEKEISPAVIPQATKIFVNGCWMGIHRDPKQLVQTLTQLRRQVSLTHNPPMTIYFEGYFYLKEKKGGFLQVDVNTEVGIVRDIRLKELRLYTDYGRCSRPLFIVEKQRLQIKKRDIIALQQRVSFLDKNEFLMDPLVVFSYTFYRCRTHPKSTIGTNSLKEDSSSTLTQKKRRLP